MLQLLVYAFTGACFEKDAMKLAMILELPNKHGLFRTIDFQTEKVVFNNGILNNALIHNAETGANVQTIK